MSAAQGAELTLPTQGRHSARLKRGGALSVSGRRTHIDTARTGDSGGAKVPAGKQPGELMLTRTSCPFSENGAGTIYCKRAAGL